MLSIPIPTPEPVPERSVATLERSERVENDCLRPLLWDTRSVKEQIKIYRKLFLISTRIVEEGLKKIIY
jgi:hypothetical protein